MSGFYDYRELHPETKAGIEYQDDQGRPDDKPCGCHQRGEQPWKWWLCSYHEGFQDGTETDTAEKERLRALRSDETREAIAKALHDSWAKELVGSPPAWSDCSVTWQDYQRGHADAVVRVLTGEEADR